MGSNPLIISAALTGAITTQAEAPALPVTPQEIADDVVACARAGAGALRSRRTTRSPSVISSPVSSSSRISAAYFLMSASFIRTPS